MKFVEYAYCLAFECLKTAALAVLVRIKPDRFIARYDIVRIRDALQADMNEDRKYAIYAARALDAFKAHHLDNLLELYRESPTVSLRDIIWRFRVRESKFMQLVRWLRCTKFLTDFSSQSLTRYYSSSHFPTYCGYLRLNNPGWLKHRCEQFEFIEQHSPELRDGSYLEYGGSTGMLPIFAKMDGFRRVVNFDISQQDLAFGRDKDEMIFGASQVEWMTAEPDEQFDVVSCHQVIEHSTDPSAFLSHVLKMLKPGGLMILSSGFHVYPHPGHIAYSGDVKDLISSVGGKIIGQSKVDSHTFYVTK